MKLASTIAVGGAILLAGAAAFTDTGVATFFAGTGSGAQGNACRSAGPALAVIARHSREPSAAPSCLPQQNSSTGPRTRDVTARFLQAGLDHLLERP